MEVPLLQMIFHIFDRFYTALLLKNGCDYGPILMFRKLPCVL